MSQHEEGDGGELLHTQVVEASDLEELDQLELLVEQLFFPKFEFNQLNCGAVEGVENLSEIDIDSLQVIENSLRVQKGHELVHGPVRQVVAQGQRKGLYE